MIAKVQTFLVVSIITVLVWIVAESASVRVETVAASIVIESTPEIAVRVSTPTNFDGGISVTLDGATARLDAVAQALRSVLSFQPGDAGIPLQAGERPIDLRHVLQYSEPLAQSGVRVVQVDPPSITVHIEPFVSRTLPVKVSMPELDLDGPVQVTPSQVSVRLPKQLADKLPADASAVAELIGTDVANIPAGQQNRIPNVLLKLPESIASNPLVRATPTQVDIALTLRRPIITRVLNNIPIILQVDPQDLDRWIIELDPQSRMLPEVTVAGARQAVTTVVDLHNRKGLVAHVIVRSEELAAAGQSGDLLRSEARFTELPTTLSFDMPNPTVLIRVRPRPQVPVDPAVPDEDQRFPKWPPNEPVSSPRPEQ